MKLSYFDKLSPDPIQIQNIGSFISPKLRDISSIGIDLYRFYLSVLSMDVKSYFIFMKQNERYESFTEQQKSQLSTWDLLTSNKYMLSILESALNFFILEDVKYSDEYELFVLSKNDDASGVISKEVYLDVCDIICQLNNVKPNKNEDLTKIKNKKALEIMKKLQKGRSEKQKNNTADKNLELGNVISAVSNKSLSLNIINIWDLTVFQLWDCFSRLANNSIYNIQSMSVAAYGNDDNYFDATSWFKRIDTDN